MDAHLGIERDTAGNPLEEIGFPMIGSCASFPGEENLDAISAHLRKELPRGWRLREVAPANLEYLLDFASDRGVTLANGYSEDPETLFKEIQRGYRALRRDHSRYAEPTRDLAETL